MENSLVGQREVRAQVSRDFRSEIQRHGLANAILSVVASNSEKVPIKRTVLAQQCRKTDFNKRFCETCVRLAASHPTLAVKIIELQNEVSAQ